MALVNEGVRKFAVDSGRDPSSHLDFAPINKFKVSGMCQFTAVATPEEELVPIITGCTQITPCEERPLQGSRYTNPSLLLP